MSAKVVLNLKVILSRVFRQTAAGGQHKQLGGGSDRESEAQVQVLGARMPAQVNLFIMTIVIYHDDI